MLFVLLIWLCIAAVIILPVVLRFAEGDPPDNGLEQTQQDEARDEDPDVMAAAA